MSSERKLFRLIRVGLGIQDAMTEPVESYDWQTIYNLAREHAVLGIVFAAIEKLSPEQRPNRAMLLQWIALTEQIKQRNKQLNLAHSNLENRLKTDGWDYSILKGQTIAKLYLKPNLRQSGDIDVWLHSRNNKKVSRRDIINYLEQNGKKVKICYLHADGIKVNNVSVEVHFRPSFSVCPWINRKISKVLIPPVDSRFNLVYMMHHIYRHLFAEGISLKQVVDYAVLVNNCDKSDFCDVKHNIAKLGMLNFAGGLIWIVEQLFGVDCSEFCIESDEKEGQYILDKIFNKNKEIGKTKLQRIKNKVVNNFQFLWKYPNEVVWYIPFVIFETLWFKLPHR